MLMSAPESRKNLLRLLLILPFTIGLFFAFSALLEVITVIDSNFFTFFISVRVNWFPLIYLSKRTISVGYCFTFGTL